jgi:hypothetical protein
MNKGAYLELSLQHAHGSNPDETRTLLQNTLAGDHDGLHIRVLHVSVDNADPTIGHAVLYVEGEQEPAEDFEQLATATIQRLWQGGQPPALGAVAPAAPRPQLASVGKWEGYDTGEDVLNAANTLVADAAAALAALPSHRSCLAPVTGAATPAGNVTPLQPIADPPTPTNGDFDGCPADGDSASEAVQNGLKNRIDVGTWQPTTVAAILGLPVPDGLPAHRGEWSADQQAAIAQFEGSPLQVVGFLAGARAEGPESCNCHSTTDVDFHLWLVDASGTGRESSVVAEITPRIRADHPGWDIEQICGLVNNQTQVRISGWLMMDPIHADQVGQTRGTLWEIHPILAVEVAQDGNWVAFDG